MINKHSLKKKKLNKRLTETKKKILEIDHFNSNSYIPNLNEKNIFLEKKETIDKKFCNDNIQLVIVSCIKNPINFDFWINYHLNKCNIKKIFLKVDNTPNLKMLIDQYPNIIEAEYINEDLYESDRYFKLIDWQIEYINKIINKCKSNPHYQFSHILHIDDDELLYFPNGINYFYEEINLNNNFDNYAIKNVEGVYPDKVNNIFKSPFFCFNTFKFTAYVNGKSFGNLSSNLTTQSPHHFNGVSHKMSPSNVLILHFESASLKKWNDKFKSYTINNLSNKNNKIPFSFYNDSIDAFKNKKISDKSQIWEKYKLIKHRDPKTLIKIDFNKSPNLINKIFLSHDPLIYLIDHFISNEDCDYIIDKAKNNLVRAKVVLGSQNIVNNDTRNNSNCWINFDKDKRLHQICQKISELVDIPLSNSESLQIINYQVNERYRPHYDAWEDNEEFNISKGQRLFTCIIYLNDVEEGGETEFPKLNLKIFPKKGRITIFSNTYKNTQRLHDLTLHGGNDVIKGEKWACNLWFRSKVYQRIEN